MNLSALTAAVAAVCPIDGVSIGNPDDKTTWSISFQAAATPDQRTAAAGILANWTDPPPETPFTFLEFLALLTQDEQAAMVSSTDPRVKVFCLMAASAPTILLSDPRVIAGITLCQNLGLVTQTRAAQILAGTPAPSA